MTLIDRGEMEAGPVFRHELAGALRPSRWRSDRNRPSFQLHYLQRTKATHHAWLQMLKSLTLNAHSLSTKCVLS